MTRGGERVGIAAAASPIVESLPSVQVSLKEPQSDGHTAPMLCPIYFFTERVMKRMLTLGLGAAMMFAAGSALAQDAKAPDASGKAAATPAMPMIAQMDEHMKKMQALHDRMMSAASPEERERAMEEARKEMREGMAIMKPMMHGEGMMGGSMMGEKGKSGNAQGQMQMLGKRMDMMQMMMQMMMDQQGTMGPPKPSDAAPKK